MFLLEEKGLKPEEAGDKTEAGDEGGLIIFILALLITCGLFFAKSLFLLLQLSSTTLKPTISSYNFLISSSKPLFSDGGGGGGGSGSGNGSSSSVSVIYIYIYIYNICERQVIVKNHSSCQAFLTLSQNSATFTHICI